MTRASHRRAFAICAALLWLLGVEALPNLHLALHENDHSHATDGTIVGSAQFEREYAEARAKRGLPPRVLEHGHEHRKRDQLAFDHAPHAANGIAHHATALHQPAPPLTTPVAAPHAEAWRFAEPSDRIDLASAIRPSARAPPVA